MMNEQKIARIKEILEAKGIKMSVSGCGCCGSPGVTLECDGEEIEVDEYANFDM